MLFYTYKNYLNFNAPAIRINSSHWLAPLQKNKLSFQEPMVQNKPLAINCFSMN